ncbi:MAG: hypothetical protein JW768_04155 [Chitinispirillaceae bacterium]|nr:hypothetical protein [Chitinispirillaceae bacterium]
MRWIVFLSAATVLSCWSADAACPLPSDFKQYVPAKKIKLLKSLPWQNIDEPCLKKAIAQSGNTFHQPLVDQLLTIIETWSEHNGMSISLFYCCTQLIPSDTDLAEEYGRRISSLWEKNNQPFPVAVAQLTEAGAQEQADSLFSAFDRCKSLHPDLLLRWAEIKEVRGHYSSVASLHCRAVSELPRIIDLSRNRLSQIFQHAPRDSVRRVLGLVRRCFFSARGIDTMRLQLWMADWYARIGCDKEEIALLRAFPSTSNKLISRLWDMANREYRSRAYGSAVSAAKKVYEKAPHTALKSQAAGLLRDAYRALNINDSAVVWLERSDLTNDRARTDAAELYHLTGRLVEAERIIKAIRPSFSRDTMEVRQLLFSGDTKEAANRVAKGGRRWNERHYEACKWKIRTLMFHGARNELSEYLDTVFIDPSRDDAEELLGYRYYLKLFSRFPAQQQIWFRMEYDFYTGHPERAMKRLSGQELEEEVRGALLLRILGQLRKQGRTTLMAQVFEEQREISYSPEYRYLWAETLLKMGETSRSRNLLLLLLRDFPATVFAEKARILLSTLTDKNN